MTSIRLGGGGARSPLWWQIQADVGGGLWPSVDAACSAVVRVAERVHPDPTSASTMEAGYAAYRRMYPAIKSIFRT